jgi:hypothetical protein
LERAEELAQAVVQRQLADCGHVENCALLFFGDDAEEHLADPTEDWESFSDYLKPVVDECDPAEVLLIHQPSIPGQDEVTALYLNRRTNCSQKLLLTQSELTPTTKETEENKCN